MTMHPQQPAVPPSVEDRREHVSESLNRAEHYLRIARSCLIIGDDQMLVDALQKLEDCAIYGSKSVRMLLAAIVADKRTGEFCRVDLKEAGRHEA